TDGAHIVTATRSLPPRGTPDSTAGGLGGRWLASHIEPPSDVMASTAPPTDVVARTLRLWASRREIPAAPPSATQTDCAATTTDDGRVPNSISVSLLVAGSMRINRLA